jgi:hypothetical protein
MSFSVTQIQFLQRLVSEKPARRSAGESARFLCEHYSIGAAVGRFIEYHDEHHRRAESLLRAHDLPVAFLGTDTSRAEMAAYGGLSEKSMSAAPHAKSVALKFIGNCRLDGRTVGTPAGSYLVATPELARCFACERLLLVENLETFRTLEGYRWIDYENQAVMAVFRGDASLSVGDALELIRTRDEPIWAFVDFDPAGLVIANSLPRERLERLVLPAVTWLRQAADSLRGRQLFADQAPRYSAVLDNSTNEAVRTCWQEMRVLRSAVTQERMASVRPLR